MAEQLETLAQTQCVISIKGCTGKFEPEQFFVPGKSFFNKGISFWQCSEDFLNLHVKGKTIENPADMDCEINSYADGSTMEDLLNSFDGKDISVYHLFKILIEISHKSVKGLNDSKIFIFSTKISETETDRIWTALNHPKRGWTIEPLLQGEEERLPWPPKFSRVIQPK